jgi:hypothetical protein
MSENTEKPMDRVLALLLAELQVACRSLQEEGVPSAVVGANLQDRTRRLRTGEYLNTNLEGNPNT